LMIRDLVASVAEFHRAFGVPVKSKPEHPSQERRELRIKLLQEEWQEYLEGERKRDLVEIADALGDLIFVAVGTALEYGIPIEAVMREICWSNLTKVGGPMREDGKILKSKDYVAPDIAGVLMGASK
jgi:predicted HAD superfamily Cof-like phosphohydrolase